MGKKSKKTSEGTLMERMKAGFRRSSLGRKMKATFTKANMKMYFKERRASLIFLGLCIAFVAWGIISVQIAKANAVIGSYKDYVPREATHVPTEVFELEDSYELVASNSEMELYFDNVHANIKLKDKVSGYEWKGVVDEEVFPTFRKSNELWKKKMRSSVIIKFNDLEARDGKSAELTQAGDCDYLEISKIENGVSVVYGFTAKGIFLTVEYVLDEDGFAVRVPVDKIVEETRYIIGTIQVLPWFGAADKEQDGYMFYPDGCGAITLFNNAQNRVQTVKLGQWRTYTTNKITLDYWLTTDDCERYTAAMPVMGIKNGNSAFLAVATKGEENSGITCYPAGQSNLELNRINFEFYVRNQFDVSQFSVTANDSSTATGRDITRIDKNILAVDREVKYFLLRDEDANYSGMARAYREYLIDNGQLTSSINKEDGYPLALSFMMGVTERQLVMDKYLVMTSFDNLIEIFNDLQSEGVEATKVVLTNWLKGDAAPPEYWPVASQLGGKKGLKKLDEYLKAHSSYNVFLNSDFVFASEDEGGFSAVSDVAFSGVSMPISSSYDIGYYLLSPCKVLENVTDFLKKTKNYSNIGVGYSGLGDVVFDDYNEKHTSSRRETIETWQTILKNTQTTGKKTAVDGANQYVYANTDYLYRIPITTYGLSITDYAVPFVQMVISGMIPYSSGTYESGNLTYDLDVQKLEWIEFGALPYFYLTYESALELKDTDYNFLFTSTYSYWRERVLATYNEFKENLGDTYGEQMVSHEVLSTYVRRVEYSNGIIIYLNYSAEEVIIDGVKIPAKDYTVIGKEAK